MRPRRLVAALVVAALMLPGCVHYRARYDLLFIPDLAHAAAPKNEFLESGVRIKWDANEAAFGFTLENRSNRRVRILWNDASYVDAIGDAHRVIHKGVSFANIEAREPPTVVPPGAYVHDVVVPAENFRIRATYDRYSLYVTPLLPVKAKSEAELKSYGQKYTGATLTLFLPLEIDGKRHDYRFEFLVKTVWDATRHVKLRRTGRPLGAGSGPSAVDTGPPRSHDGPDAPGTP